MKRNGIILFFILTAFLADDGCKKDTPAANNNISNNNTGYVKEYYTNKPIPNAEVAVYADMNYLQLKEKVFTDSSGKFITSENIYNNANILVTKSGYFQYSFSIAQTNRDRNNNIFYLDMPAYIQTHIKNVNHQTAQIFVSGFPSDLVPPSGTLQLQGNNIDTTICCILSLGYKAYSVHAYAIRSSSDTTINHPCSPIGNQTITVNIFY